MWSRWPLTGKIALTLFLMQALVLGAGAFWLGHWVRTSRLDELQHYLDTQADVIESLVVVSGGRFVYQDQGEFAQELERDHNLYFLALGADGRVLFDSAGPPAGRRAQLRERMQGLSVADDQAVLIDVDRQHWLIQQGTLERSAQGVVLGVRVRVAINAQPTLDAVSAFVRMVTLVGFCSLLLCALGGYLLVSYSTRNLRAFAQHLRSLRPPEFQRSLVFAPRCAEERQLFDSYREMEQAVGQVLEGQRLFIANASHELKTPISAVTSALEVILARPRSADDYAETCRDVLAEMTVLKRLSTSLLDMARLDAASGRCELARTARQLVERWERLARRRGVVLETQIEGHLPLAGSDEQWEVVLNNLLDNAIKYSTVGGRVCLSLSATRDGRAELQVRDEGCGMSAEEVQQLGRVFFRADPARSGGDSFGLGFAHARRIVECLGGTIDVRSQPGRGTCVTVLSGQLVGATVS